jgi:hypothetical protein
MTRRHRRPERVGLVVGAVWTLLLATITLFPYQAWLTGSGYRTLEDAGELGAAGLVGELAGVTRVYGLGLVLVALVCALLAWRLPAVGHRLLVAWLVVCVVGSLLTRDVVGLLVFGVVLVLTVARRRAERTVAATSAPTTHPEKTRS